MIALVRQLRVITVALVLAITWLLWSSAGTVVATSLSQASLEPLTPAEQWVLEQVTSGEGEVAALDKRFPTETERVLRGSFLQSLLTGGFPNVQMRRRGVQIEKAVVTGPIDLRYAEVPYEVRLDTCRFTDSIDFSGSHFDRGLVLPNAEFAGLVSFSRARFGLLNVSGAKFANAEQETDFNSMVVESGVFVNGAKFDGPVNFAYAETSYLNAREARFANVQDAARFYNMVVKGEAQFSGAEFAGPVNFLYAKFGLLDLGEARFTSTEGGAKFASIVVGGHAFFTGAEFAGPVNFIAAHVAGQFEAKGAKFTSTKGGAKFDSIVVGGHAFFTDAEFAGPLDFVAAHVAGQFDAKGAKFTSTEGGANFDSIVVGENAFFTDAEFAGPVDFGCAEFRNLHIRDAKFTGVDKPIDFTNVKVNGTIFVENVQIVGKGQRLKLDAMVYQKISAGSQVNAPLKWLWEAAYSPSAYEELEAFYREQGQLDLANEVYIDRKLRERQEIFHGPWWSNLKPDRWLRWLWNAFLEGFVHYGRSPSWALGWGGLIVVGSWWICWRSRDNVEKKDPAKGESNLRPYNKYTGFLYSLELFVPGLNLQMADDWRPNGRIRGPNACMVVQKILGWLVIPIAVAAVTGIIK